MRILPITKYRLKNGKYYPTFKYTLHIKIFLAVALLIASLTVVTRELGTSNSVYSVDSPYVQYIIKTNPSISLNQARSIVTSIITWSEKFNIDEKVLLAVAKVESGFNPHAISTSGAYGLMQVIPVWHKDKILKAREVLGNPEVFNIHTNIYLGSWVLKDCLNRLNNLGRALMCYSGQTPGYDNKVLKEYNNLKTQFKI